MKPAATREHLWEALSELFEKDDGSLPEVRVVNLSPSGIAGIFARLRAAAEPLEPDVAIWDNRHQGPRLLSDVPDAAMLAATGEIDPFHVLLRGVESHGVRLPDLGVFALPGEIAIDYRMGEEWNDATLAAFVELLGGLVPLDPEARLDLQDIVHVEWRDCFRRAVDAYLRATE